MVTRSIRPPRSPLSALHDGFRLVEIAQHHSGRADQCGPRFTQDDAAADAVKQRHPEFTLEGGDRLRQRRLGDHQMLGGAAEAVVVDHREEELQLPDVHRRASRLRR